MHSGEIAFAGQLIRPHAQWAGLNWDMEAESVHNIARAELVRDGVDVEEVAKWALAEIGDGVIYTDAPDFDGAWLAMILEAADCRLDARRFLEGRIRYSSGPDCVDTELANLYVREEYRLGLRRHRAADDAMRLALTYRLCFE
jgi:hypothetical protein